jgi:hypothetical protein
MPLVRGPPPVRPAARPRPQWTAPPTRTAQAGPPRLATPRRATCPPPPPRAAARCTRARAAAPASRCLAWARAWLRATSPVCWHTTRCRCAGGRGTPKQPAAAPAANPARRPPSLVRRTAALCPDAMPSRLQGLPSRRDSGAGEDSGGTFPAPDRPLYSEVRPRALLRCQGCAAPPRPASRPPPARSTLAAASQLPHSSAACERRPLHGRHVGTSRVLAFKWRRWSVCWKARPRGSLTPLRWAWPHTTTRSRCWPSSSSTRRACEPLPCRPRRDAMTATSPCAGHAAWAPPRVTRPRAPTDRLRRRASHGALASAAPRLLASCAAWRRATAQTLSPTTRARTRPTCCRCAAAVPPARARSHRRGCVVRLAGPWLPLASDFQNAGLDPVPLNPAPRAGAPAGLPRGAAPRWPGPGLRRPAQPDGLLPRCHRARLWCGPRGAVGLRGGRKALRCGRGPATRVRHTLPADGVRCAAAAPVAPLAGHPQLTNDFLIATGDALAIRYNDRGERSPFARLFLAPNTATRKERPGP